MLKGLEWMIKELVLRQDDSFKRFVELYNSCPSCNKGAYNYENYRDCMMEKINWCYENVRNKSI